MSQVAAAVVVLILLWTMFQFALTVHPPRHRSDATPADVGLAYEDVAFETSDGLTLRGWFVPAANQTNRTVLVGHGYPFDKGNVLGVSMFLHGAFNLFFFDMRSFGESDGRITTVGHREVRDVEAALDYLEGRGDSDVVGAYGFSLSAATFLMAQDARIQAIVSDASYARLDWMAERQYFYLPGPLKLPFVGLNALYAKVLLGVWPSDVNPARAIHATPSAVLLIHGTEDSQIPVRHAHHLYENAPKDRVDLWLIEGADHGATTVVAGAEYERRVAAFFHDHLTPWAPGPEPRTAQ